jgi:hypothetical protein
VTMCKEGIGGFVTLGPFLEFRCCAALKRDMVPVVWETLCAGRLCSRTSPSRFLQHALRPEWPSSAISRTHCKSAGEQSLCVMGPNLQGLGRRLFGFLGHLGGFSGLVHFIFGGHHDSQRLVLHRESERPSSSGEIDATLFLRSSPSTEAATRDGYGRRRSRALQWVHRSRLCHTAPLVKTRLRGPRVSPILLGHHRRGERW